MKTDDFLHDILKRFCLFLVLAVLFPAFSGCVVFRKITLNYSTAKMPSSQIVYNVQYWSSSENAPAKNRLDLFLPPSKNWPTFIFVHGEGMDFRG